MALKWRDDNQPNAAWAQRYHADFELAMDFLAESQTASEAEALRQAEQQRTEEQLKAERRSTNRLRLLVGLAFVMLLLAVWQWVRAKDQRQIAETQKEQAIHEKSQAIAAKGEALLASQQAEKARAEATMLKLAFAAEAQLPINPHLAALLAVEVGRSDYPSVSASAHQILRLVSAMPWYTPRVLAGHRDDVTFAAWSPDGTQVATVSTDGTARVWDATSDAEPIAFRDLYPLTHTAWNATGTRMITSGRGGQPPIVWDTTSGEELVALSGHGCCVVWQAAWRADGKQVATAGQDGTVRVWHAETGTELACLAERGCEAKGDDGEPPTAVLSVTRNWDGSRLLTTGAEGMAQVWAWDGQNGSRLLHLQGHEEEDAVTGAAWNAAETRIVTISTDNTARIWDAETGTMLGTLAEHTGAVTQATWRRDGQLLVTASQDGTARIWKINTDGTATQQDILVGHSGPIRSIAWHDLGRQLLTASDDGTARIWDVRTGAERAILAGHQGKVTQVRSGPETQHIITASTDGTARVWRAEKRSAMRLLSGHRGPVVQARWSPDGREIATAGIDGRVFIQPLGETGAYQRRRRLNFEAPVRQIAWSPDGNYLLIAIGTKVQVRHTKDAKKYRLFKHAAPVRQVAWSPDGTQVMTISSAQEVAIWDTKPIEANEPLALSHPRTVTHAAWSPDGTQVAVGLLHVYGQVQVWEISTGRKSARQRISMVIAMACYTWRGIRRVIGL